MTHNLIVRLHGLLFIFLLSACSQTPQQPISQTEPDLATPVPAVSPRPQLSEVPEFWSRIPLLTSFHNNGDGLSWKLTNTGIETRDHSIGETLDINRIEQVWSNYETEIVQSANKYGVPIELILTTISVESAGDSNANSGGNYGLMQIRLKTAQKSLPNKELVSADLFNPAIAIEAGTSYLKMQYEGKGWFRQSTNFDLPKVVAAYNSGRIYDAPSTPWGMKINAPSHIDKSVVYFNDALLFLSRQEDIPQMSFAAYFATQQ